MSPPPLPLSIIAANFPPAFQAPLCTYHAPGDEKFELIAQDTRETNFVVRPSFRGLRHKHAKKATKQSNNIAAAASHVHEAAICRQ